MPASSEAGALLTDFWRGGLLKKTFRSKAIVFSLIFSLPLLINIYSVKAAELTVLAVDISEYGNQIWKAFSVLKSVATAVAAAAVAFGFFKMLYSEDSMRKGISIVIYALMAIAAANLLPSVIADARQMAEKTAWDPHNPSNVGATGESTLNNTTVYTLQINPQRSGATVTDLTENMDVDITGTSGEDIENEVKTAWTRWQVTQSKAVDFSQMTLRPTADGQYSCTFKVPGYSDIPEVVGSLDDVIIGITQEYVRLGYLYYRDAKTLPWVTDINMDMLQRVSGKYIRYKYDLSGMFAYDDRKQLFYLGEINGFMPYEWSIKNDRKWYQKAGTRGRNGFGNTAYTEEQMLEILSSFQLISYE